VIEAGRATRASALAELNQQLTVTRRGGGRESLLDHRQRRRSGTEGERIALLNGAIVALLPRGPEPNDLLDRRDLLLDELSLTRHVSFTELNEREPS